jgi:hypothetical protein
MTILFWLIAWINLEYQNQYRKLSPLNLIRDAGGAHLFEKGGTIESS